ncbi:MAG: DNA-deoxyinosine glycosylase [Tahibacter sp.]
MSRILIVDKEIKRLIGQPSEARVASFDAFVSARCRVLVLGSMPGTRSLAMAQYYAHPQNLFWPFMQEICGAGPALAYPERVLRLRASGIGVWDVLQQCERLGSLDSAIVADSERPNDLVGLLMKHPSIRLLAFNGGKAMQAYRRHVQPRWPAELSRRVDLLALPSTSPANASISRADKLAAWLRLRDYLNP